MSQVQIVNNFSNRICAILSQVIQSFLFTMTIGILKQANNADRFYINMHLGDAMDNVYIFCC